MFVLELFLGGALMAFMFLVVNPIVGSGVGLAIVVGLVIAVEIMIHAFPAQPKYIAPLTREDTLRRFKEEQRRLRAEQFAQIPNRLWRSITARRASAED